MSIVGLAKGLALLGGASYAGYKFVESNAGAIGRTVGRIFSSAATEAMKSGAEQYSEAIKEAVSKFSENLAENLSKAMVDAASKVKVGADQLLKELSNAHFNFNREIAANMFWAYGPYIAAGVTLTAGLPLIFKYIYKNYEHHIGKPSMQMEAKTSSWLSTIGSALASPVTVPYNWVFGSAPVRPIFKPDLHEQIQDIIKSTKNINRNKGEFESVLLYGPPGTGKTMVAREIAEESGMDFYLTSAAEWSAFIARKEHVTELNKFLNKIEKSGRPAVIFFDEFEAIGKDRGKLDQEHYEILTTLLSRTGAASKKIMLVTATNRKQDLDPAILNRMTHKVFIDVPDFEERVKILEMYINKFFTEREIRQFFSADRVHDIAQKIEGFSGRTIQQMINTIYNKKATTSNGRLTDEIIDKKVDQFVAQEQETRAQQST
jgi:ATPase family AAA domain-containing protein 3A/B